MNNTNNSKKTIISTIVLIIIGLLLISITICINCLYNNGLVDRDTLSGEIVFWLCLTLDSYMFAINGVALIIYAIYRSVKQKTE